MTESSSFLDRRALLFAGILGSAAWSAPSRAADRLQNAWSLKDRFHCVADGRDEQTRISDAILEAKVAGRGLLAPPGVYGHSDVLDFGDVALIGAGSKRTEFRALTPDRSAIRIGGIGAHAEAFCTTSPNAFKRVSDDEGAGFYAKDAVGFHVSDVVALGSACAGQMYRSCSHGKMHQLQARSTYADGIHMTGGCHDLTLTAPRVQDAGDDGVAIVSYVHDRAICQDINVWHAQVYNTVRGVSVVGGRRVRHFAPRVFYSHYCAIYFLGEESYNTFGLQDVVSYDADVYGPNQSYNTHCAVMIGGREGSATTADGEALSLSAEGCGFVRLRIRGDLRTRARAGVGLDPGSRGAFLHGCSIEDFVSPKTSGIEIGGIDPVLEDVTVKNVSGSFLALAPTAEGIVRATRLVAEDVCQADTLNRVLNFGGAPHLAGARVNGLSIRGSNARSLMPFFPAVTPDGIRVLQIRTDPST